MTMIFSVGTPPPLEEIVLVHGTSVEAAIHAAKTGTFNLPTPIYNGSVKGYLFGYPVLENLPEGMNIDAFDQIAALGKIYASKDCVSEVEFYAQNLQQNQLIFEETGCVPELFRDDWINMIESWQISERLELPCESTKAIQDFLEERDYDYRSFSTFLGRIKDRKGVAIGLNKKILQYDLRCEIDGDFHIYCPQGIPATTIEWVLPLGTEEESQLEKALRKAS